MRAASTLRGEAPGAARRGEGARRRNDGLLRRAAEGLPSRDGVTWATGARRGECREGKERIIQRSRVQAFFQKNDVDS